MKHYVGLDRSLEATTICMVDENGQMLKMTSAPSDPQAIGPAPACQQGSTDRAGEPEALDWLTRELRALGLPVVCLIARQTHCAVSGRI